MTAFTRPILFFCSLMFLFLAVFGCVTNNAKPAEELLIDVDDMRALVGPGDVIEIRVYREKELSGVFEVNSEGMLQLPLLETIEVKNLTTAEMTAKIETAYNAKYLKNAQVTVFVKEYNSRKIIVVGEVKKPGPIPYRVRMTILEAVARAGGITRLAAPQNTIIIREKNGDPERYNVNLNRVKRGEDSDIMLYPGDVVSVPVSMF